VHRLPRLARPSGFALVRWLGVVVVLGVAFAYIQPIRSFFQAKQDVAHEKAVRTALLHQQASLRHRLDLVESDDFIAREARRIGLVRPGERLFIVKGVEPAS
jgi:hypothetical protein